MKTLILILTLMLAGCTTLESMKDMTPEQAEKLNYLRSMSSELKGSRRLDDYQTNNASKTPRAQ